MDGQVIKKVLETHFPIDLAYEWDNVGLQIGTMSKNFNKILISLDITKDTVDEAIETKTDLIIVHHPLLFRAIKTINTDSYQGSIIEKLLANNITLYVAHTNFDISNNGMNKMLADMLNIKNQEVLDFTTETEGLGRIGTVKEQNIEDFINFAKDTFSVNDARFIGNLNSKVSKVAITGGSGSSVFRQAKIKNADLYITGDITYHTALDILALGLNVLDIGHNIESHFGTYLKDLLVKENVKCNIILTEIDTNPYIFV
ncbi:MAG: Nif3-like dinuclear metal center hexameric protein [Candidatus Izemoplasma sp.]